MVIWLLDDLQFFRFLNHPTNLVLIVILELRAQKTSKSLFSILTPVYNRSETVNLFLLTVMIKQIVYL